MAVDCIQVGMLVKNIRGDFGEKMLVLLPLDRKRVIRLGKDDVVVVILAG